MTCAARTPVSGGGWTLLGIAIAMLLGGGIKAAAQPQSQTQSQAAEQPQAAVPTQEPPPTSPATPSTPVPTPRKFHVAVEAKVNLRDSQDTQFPLRSPYPGSGGEQAYQETVDPGTHGEVSSLSLQMDYQASPLFQAHLRFDGLNLYYRNPTSTDRQYDLAELWVRWGREPRVAVLPAAPGFYVRAGKFRRAEQQADRHLESYGLVTTAFDRWEDAGVELGGDLGRHFFVKAALTQGNPLFIRDPNALAGDTPDLLGSYDQARLNSGMVVLYDTHVESISFAHPEYAGYLGYRLADAAGGTGLEVMGWGRQRTLANSIGLPGSPIGGDLAILVGPGGAPILPFHGDTKQELGLNVWLYHDSGLSLYSQLVAQRVAGLARTGVEAEAAWRIELPLVWAAGGHQLFRSIAPAVRYSQLNDGFHNLFPTSEPSLAWNWQKYDGGLRIALWMDLDLTVEYSYNRIFLDPQQVINENEALATLRIRI